jgi:hypothetical protein
MIDLYGLLFAAIGIFSCCGGIFDWEWFMNNRKAQRFVRLLGRSNTRIFYVVLGLAFLAGGVLIMLGVIQLPQNSN